MDQLTPDTLTPWLRTHLGADARCRAVTRGPVGNGQEIWFVEVDTAAGQRPLVVRRTASGGPLEWTDRAQEFAVMRAVSARGLPVPRPHWYDDSAALDRPCFVMDRAPGSPAMAAAADEPERAAADLGRQLARLHALDPDELDTGIAPHADAAAATRAEVVRWQRRYAADRVAPVPLLGALLTWLEHNVPDDRSGPALLWGDPGRHNALIEDGRISALLDWELAHLGHPLEDLGIAVWMELDTGVEPELVVRAYEAERGAGVDRRHLDFFVAMACVTRSVMVVAGAESFVAGRTTEPSAAALGLDLLAVNVLRAARLAGWPAPPDAPPPDVPADPAPDTQLRPAAAEVDERLAEFLRGQVLPAVDDARLRRQVKTAVALLRTSALRIGVEAAVTARRREATAALLDELGAADATAPTGLEALARRLEADPAAGRRRERVRAHLVADLAAEAALLQPLRELYGRRR